MDDDKVESFREQIEQRLEALEKSFNDLKTSLDALGMQKALDEKKGDS